MGVKSLIVIVVIALLLCGLVLVFNKAPAGSSSADSPDDKE